MSKETFRCVGFAPRIDKSCTVLILGSMPSAASLAAGQYYAHPQNRFWPLMARLLEGYDVPSEDYEERLAMLLRHHVALWDAIDACDREGFLMSFSLPHVRDFGNSTNAGDMMDDAQTMVGNGNTDAGIDMTEDGSNSEEPGNDKTDLALDSLDNIF